MSVDIPIPRASPVVIISAVVVIVVLVLADNQLREQFHRLARRRQLVERRQRNERLVADAVDVHDDLRGQRLDEFALEKSDHLP